MMTRQKSKLYEEIAYSSKRVFEKNVQSKTHTSLMNKNLRPKMMNTDIRFYT